MFDDKFTEITAHIDAFDAATHGIAILENDRFIYINRSYAQMFGYEVSELLGQHWQCLHSPRQAELLRAMMPVAIAQYGQYQGEVIGTRRDGSTFDEEISLSLLPNGQLMSICMDITARKAVEAQLRATNQALLQATRLKDEFLTNISHEIRTPLNTILGMSEILKQEVFGTLNQDQLKSLLVIDQSGEHLLSLLNDIIDTSLISGGVLKLNISPVSAVALCHSSLAFFKQQALDKNIQFELQVPPDPCNIAVDERRIQQVLMNLLSNALKFTPSSGRIHLKMTSDNDIVFVITDTGIGIDSADWDKIFQPFIRLDSRFNRPYEGTGLGLTLVKQIVELHGGSISLYSEIGKGSSFTVRLPYTCKTIELDNQSLIPFDIRPNNDIDRQGWN